MCEQNYLNTKTILEEWKSIPKNLHEKEVEQKH